MKKALLLALAVMAALVTGCPRNQYVIEIKPAAEGMERSLTCWREDEDEHGNRKLLEFPAEELAALQRLYTDYRFDSAEQKHSLNGRFGGATPDDVGGAGFLTNYVNSVGTAYLYEERFRGKDDLLDRWEKRQQAADQLVDLLTGWFKSELAADPRFERLRAFMDYNLRKDIKNVSLYAWQNEVASGYKSGVTDEFIVRVGQYFHERGYFQSRDLPLILRGYENGAYMPQRLALLQRMVAERMGVPEGAPVPASLGFLSSEEEVKKSLEKYMRTTEIFKRKIREWEEARKEQPETPEPRPADVLGELAGAVIDSDGRGATLDRLTLKLATQVPPVKTNGKWDAASGRVVWESGIEQSQFQMLPTVCYATWVKPDEAFQKEHFGRVILAGEELMEYCFWRAGLPEKEAKLWDEFVKGLTPGVDLMTKMDTFRLPAVAGAEPGGDNLSDPGRNLIKGALEKPNP